ncbi:MAG: Na+/H+ antiporter NhaA, partial [Nitrospirae bacterium]
EKEASSGIILIIVTLLALVWSNSPFSETYHHFWQSHLSISFGQWSIDLTLREWIDEALMCVFFFLVGLEIKREFLVGELSSPKKAALPVVAAVGGMVVPAVIYYLLNKGQPTVSGWGIPMATDIAFALGVLYVLGERVPAGLKVFLSALAIADDLGAVLVIALFYTETVVVHNLLIALLVLFIIAVGSYFYVRSTLFYVLLSIVLWFFILHSGIHSTVAGILVALFIPAKGRIDTDRFLSDVSYYIQQFQCPIDGCGETILENQAHLSAVQSIEVACHSVETPLQRLEHALHPWVAYVVVPLFALANAGVELSREALSHIFSSPVLWGVFLGLVIGKPLGVFMFTCFAVKTGVSELPEGVSFRHILGVAILAGIGFTMSLFIAMLSFNDMVLLDDARVAILGGSLVAGITGTAVLMGTTKKRPRREF